MSPPLGQLVDAAVAHHRAGRPGEAVGPERRAIAVRPEWAAAHQDPSLAPHAGGAVGVARRVGALGRSAGGDHRLGTLLAGAGQPVDAAAAFRLAFTADPASAASHVALGNVLAREPADEPAIQAQAADGYRAALSQRPDDPAVNNLANVLRAAGRLDEAIALYRRAAELGPDAVGPPWNTALIQLLTGDNAATAALVSRLDLVIAAATVVAHLSAALGRPTWVLVPFAPDWRWLLDRDDSPW